MKKNILVLVEPEMPANTGNIARTCVITNTALHLVRPLGFQLTDRYIKRAGMDYWEQLDLTVWDSLEEFLPFMEEHVKDGYRAFYATTKGRIRHDEMGLTPQIPWMILCGKESAGLPAFLREQHPERCFRIPMDPSQRSLNLSNAAAIMVYEALRQQGWPNLQ